MIIRGIAWRIAEVNLAAALVDEPVDEFGETLRRPILEGKNGFGADEEAPAIMGAESRGEAFVDDRIAPIFVVRIDNRDAVGAQHVEETFDLVFVRVRRAALQQPLASFGRKSDAVRNAGQPGKDRAGEGPSQNVNAIVTAGPEQPRAREQARG